MFCCCCCCSFLLLGLVNNLNSELGSLGAQKCSKKPKGRAHRFWDAREEVGEKHWRRGSGSRKQKSRFQLRAPLAAASSGLPDFPPRPTPPRPAPPGSRVRSAWWADSGAWKGARRREAGGGGGRRGPSLPLPQVGAEPPRAGLRAERGGAGMRGSRDPVGRAGRRAGGSCPRC